MFHSRVLCLPSVRGNTQKTFISPSVLDKTLEEPLVSRSDATKCSAPSVYSRESLSQVFSSGSREFSTLRSYAESGLYVDNT